MLKESFNINLLHEYIELIYLLYSAMYEEKILQSRGVADKFQFDEPSKTINVFGIGITYPESRAFILINEELITFIEKDSLLGQIIFTIYFYLLFIEFPISLYTYNRHSNQELLLIEYFITFKKMWTPLDVLLIPNRLDNLKDKKIASLFKEAFKKNEEKITRIFICREET